MQEAILWLETSDHVIKHRFHCDVTIETFSNIDKTTTQHNYVGLILHHKLFANIAIIFNITKISSGLIETNMPRLHENVDIRGNAARYVIKWMDMDSDIIHNIVG